jgi:hypothetical protein
MTHFFISYNQHDEAWAEWIAWALYEAGYKVTIAAWDFHAGGDFVVEMQKAASECEKTIAILSDNYLNADYVMPEWGAAFKRDPKGEKRILIPIKVKECEPQGILGQRIRIDLTRVPEKEEARKRLLTEIKGKGRPLQEPSYPGSGDVDEVQDNQSSGLRKRTNFPQEPPFPSLQDTPYSEKRAFLLRVFNNFVLSILSISIVVIMFCTIIQLENSNYIQLEHSNYLMSLTEEKSGISLPFKNNLSTQEGAFISMEYKRLADFLDAKMWEEADKETFQLMLSIAHGRKEMSLRSKDILSYPCESLIAIDDLWTSKTDNSEVNP